MSSYGQLCRSGLGDKGVRVDGKLEGIWPGLFAQASFSASVSPALTILKRVFTLLDEKSPTLA